MFCDFIEIGTSDFDTEIQIPDNKVGISIEPVKFYLDKLPYKHNCIKLNIGISNYNGKSKVYYIPESNIIKYNLPDWVRGCNSINSYHRTVLNLCEDAKLNIENIADTYEIDVQTLFQTMNDMKVEGVYYLKIDTEGHDTTILKKFYEDVIHNTDLPHVILFESNTLSTRDDVDEIIKLYIEKGYDLILRGTDTKLQLNLKKLKYKSQFSNGIHNYYIMDYPSNYNTHELPHENSLEGAKDYCIKHNCSGITLQDSIYQVRNGIYINYYKDDNLVSWIYL
jgi:hypothetical protein